MKIVRYNDKFWFGKHKGLRLSEIIKLEPNYIIKLVKEEKIKLDDKSTQYFESRYGNVFDGRVRNAEARNPFRERRERQRIEQGEQEQRIEQGEQEQRIEQGEQEQRIEQGEQENAPWFPSRIDIVSYSKKNGYIVE